MKSRLLQNGKTDKHWWPSCKLSPKSVQLHQNVYFEFSSLIMQQYFPSTKKSHHYLPSCIIVLLNVLLSFIEYHKFVQCFTTGNVSYTSKRSGREHKSYTDKAAPHLTETIRKYCNRRNKIYFQWMIFERGLKKSKIYFCSWLKKLGHVKPNWRYFQVQPNYYFEIIWSKRFGFSFKLIKCSPCQNWFQNSAVY